jgi:hypothetical protein
MTSEATREPRMRREPALRLRLGARQRSVLTLADLVEAD